MGKQVFEHSYAYRLRNQNGRFRVDVMNFSTIQSEGSLISADLLMEIASGTAAGQQPADFAVSNPTSLNNEIAACWSDARAYWAAFQHGLRRVGENESGATPTRELWMLPVLRSLGFDGIAFARSAAIVGGQSYAVSHRLGDGDDGLPIHIEGANNDLDKRSPTGRPRISPHSLLQEYLNRTDHLWGMLSNGYNLRILRNAARMSRPIYLEFDLKQLMEGERFSEFQTLYRIIHRSRWPQNLQSSHECWLEKYYQQGIESGGRIREGLRNGVEEAIKIFGNGFLEHPENKILRDRIKSGSLAANDYYRQVLRLIYRFLFLMVSEERNLVGPDPQNDFLRKVYENSYGISRFRAKVERPFNPSDRHYDQWEAVKQTFLLYSCSETASAMAIAALNGDLFGPAAIPDLMNSYLANKDFLHGFAHLSLFKDGGTTRRINYAYLDVEELGSVYESLLDYHPVIQDKESQPKFVLMTGTERKSTGSYYTRPELVQELIKSALEPVMDDRLRAAQTKDEKEKALLSLKVCDPASGSGHFLLSAARRIGRELAKIRLGEEQPTPSQFRLAVRDVIQHCIYGVDLNPLAVDLCKVALWLEGHNRGLPLTFLDHRIKCGNSLVGVDSLERMSGGIPDEAYKPVSGDSKEVAKAIKARNKKECKDWAVGQLKLNLNFSEILGKDLEAFVNKTEQLNDITETDPISVQRKQQTYESIRRDSDWNKDWTAANIWTAAFFAFLTNTKDPSIPTTDELYRFLENPALKNDVVKDASKTAEALRFFHWPLEFPEIISAGGFDVVLGNPPWERIKLQEQEFFAVRDVAIAAAPNKAQRELLIKALPSTNPRLFGEFLGEKHYSEATSQFMRFSGRFPLTSVGDINTYALFAELFRSIVNDSGRAGIIVPTGIATDDTCKKFFADVNGKKALVSLYDFENKEALFQGVHRSYKFCLFTTTSRPVEECQFSFFLTRTAHLDDDIRRFTLSPDDLRLINPNTRTTPVFRTKVDAELTKAIYQRVPVLINEQTGENPWGISFFTMFHMANDSHLFHREPAPNRLPLYEAKMIHQFDHRFGTWEGVAERGNVHLPSPTPEQYTDPSYTTKPWYWVEKDEVEGRLRNWNKGWLMGFRDVARATDERTAILSQNCPAPGSTILGKGAL